jgi:ParB family chromosome partitioning protein
MGRKTVDLQSRFNGAISATRQEKKIAELQAEIEQLREQQAPELEAQIETLRQELQARSGEQDIPVSEIDPNPDQPRKTFLSESIDAMARSLARDGQIAALILIPNRDRYLLWDGERRWRAAQQLGWQHLRGVMAPLPENLHRKALVTFLQHENLNPLDRAEAVVLQVHDSTGIPFDYIPGTVRALVRRLERHSEMQRVRDLLNQEPDVQQRQLATFDLADEQQLILGILLDLQLNPASFAANDLQMLGLPGDIKSAIRERGLRGSHALVLQKLSSQALQVSEEAAASIRAEAIEKTLDLEFTVSQTRSLVRNLLAERSASPSPDSYLKAKALIRSIDRITFGDWDSDSLQSIRQALQTKLKELDSYQRSGKPVGNTTRRK